MPTIPPGTLCAICRELPAVHMLLAPGAGYLSGVGTRLPYCDGCRQALIRLHAQRLVDWIDKRVDPALQRDVFRLVDQGSGAPAVLRLVPGKATWEDASHYRLAVYEAARALHREGKPIDAPGVAERFRQSGNPKLTHCSDRRIREWNRTHAVTLPAIAASLDRTSGLF